MKKLIICSCIIACHLCNTYAQDLKILSATGQSNNSGPAGSGSWHYIFHLSSNCKGIVLDSAYIGGRGIKIGAVNSQVQYDTIQHTYTILVVVYDYSPNRRIGPIPPSRCFAGDVMIIYRYKGKVFTFVVKKLQYLPALCSNCQ